MRSAVSRQLSAKVLSTPDPGPRTPDPSSFYIFTTGCKSNQWDSYVIADRLKNKGFAEGRLESAGILIVNGCTLTQHAERDIRRFIRRARELNPAAKIVLTGCHAQAYPDRAFGADLVLGHKESAAIGDLLNATGCMSERTRDIPLDSAAVNGTFTGKTRFFFKIQDGCDRFCTYCIVPYARGRVRSRPLAEIIDGMARLARRGVQEVVLTGIDIASYRDPATNASFVELLQMLESAETPSRIRLSSVEPEAITPGFAATLGISKKLASSIHIPLQSADAAILTRMGRSYRKDDVRSIVSMLREQIDGIGIGMDVMAGFPGEDERAFMETYEFLEELPIFYLHVFPYSDREGTRASQMDGKVAPAAKKERVRKLKQLDAAKREAFCRRFIGQAVTIIPEGKLYRNRYMRGYSANYLPVHIPFRKELENTLVSVTIERLERNLLIGG